MASIVCMYARSSPIKGDQHVTGTDIFPTSPDLSQRPWVLRRQHRFIVTHLSMAEQRGTLPVLPSSYHEPTSSSDDVPDNEKEDVTPDKSFSGPEDADEKPQYVNGEPVIQSGRDVSKFLVDLRDDQDPPFTFRSVVLGTVIGGLGAALFQVCHLGSVDTRLRKFACRSICSNPLKWEPRRCFYSSSSIHSGNFGRPSSRSVLW
jgi:hypothetical protein